MRPSLTLLVSTYNRPDALDRCLLSVARQTVHPDEVLVLDDGSRPDTADALVPWYGRLPLVHLWQKDDGYRLVRSRNIGIAFASGDYVVSIDGDMVLPADCIADHLSVARPGRYVQGARIHLDPEYTREVMAGAEPERMGTSRRMMGNWMKRRYLLRCPLISSLLSKRIRSGPARRTLGCNQSFWRSDLRAVNGFDEAFHGFGTEDQDLCNRLIRGGVEEYLLRYKGQSFHLFHPYNQNWSEELPPDLRAPVACANGVNRILKLGMDVGALKSQAVRKRQPIQVPG